MSYKQEALDLISPDTAEKQLRAGQWDAELRIQTGMAYALLHMCEQLEEIRKMMEQRGAW